MACGAVRIVEVRSTKHHHAQESFTTVGQQTWYSVFKTSAHHQRASQRVGYWEPADFAKRSASEAGPNTSPAATTNIGPPKFQGINWNLTPIN
jgi:hypothetical protein